ncbi:dihydropteroate synthase [Amnibacterium sp.]|uniref:dihydropteroate synthase n=1 Tax=Amnibacterium sp. TaxID=1872496 RepID=UPI00260B84AC|nr:dihydropteroate synthase [Amnibacterium sp.]MCU1475200.1 folP [Amnibacterium sp.]
MIPARPLLLGVLNTTPDSFSDGGRYLDAAAAIAHGRALVAQGADVVDVGGESTRPGADPVPVAEELRRTIPVVAGLVGDGIRVSIDTRSATVAAEAIAAGAGIVNDVSGGTADPRMLGTVAGSAAELVLMHSRGAAATPPRYTDVVAEVRAELERRVASARAAGIPDERLVLDPGIGFAKGAAENWALLASVDDLRIDGIRLLVGVSRKRFLAALAPHGAPAEARDLPTAVLSALLAERGVWGLRVHDVAATRVALEVVARLVA